MKGIRVPHLVVISAICWLALIGIQVKWISDSRDLIEEQFDQKVSLALCAAVGSLDSSTVLACSAPGGGIDQQLVTMGLAGESDDIPHPADARLRQAVAEGLAFYDIHLDFDIELADSKEPSCDPASPYCCVLSPFEQNESALMSIVFPEKTQYLYGQMWVMLASSVFILLFILGVFILALRSLILQKRISQWNIDFFNNMAHEFKTPLTNIRLAMQRLKSKHPELSHDRYAGIIGKEGDKLSSQIDGVLKLSSYESEGVYLKPQQIDLQELLSQVINDMQLQIQSSGATVRLLPSVDRARITGDPFHLGRAFKNLIDNAIKYSGENPVIEITCEKRGDQVALIFDDNGVGIPKPEREMIFNKYHRVANGNVHDKKGFGIGLSYVKMIIDDHKGNIRVLHKQTPGSQFELTLPLIAS